MDHQVPVGQQGYFQGPFPHPLFPPWPVQSPPGALPVFQPYPVQGMPHLCNESQSASDSETDKEAGDFQVSAPDRMHKNSLSSKRKRGHGYDPALDHEMQAHVEDAASLDNRNKEVVVDVKQGSKKSDKDRKSKVAPDALDKKTVGPIRKGKTSKMSPLGDARARDEKLRAFKADIQKMKKKKEEEYRKRLEVLKMEREKRIAAKTAQLASSQKTRKQLPTKLALSSVKGTKFSDSEPGSSSPPQRSKIRTASTGKPSFPIVHPSQESMGVQKEHYDNHDNLEKTDVISEYAAIRAPASPMEGVDIEPIQSQVQEQPRVYEVTTSYAEKEPPNSSSMYSAEKPYLAPLARLSSLEDPCTDNSEYGKAPSTNLETATMGLETAKAQVSGFENLKLEKILEVLEKPQVKVSPEGFRQLLKFGKKSHSSIAGEHSVESDNVSVSGSEVDGNATNAASSSEVHTLKNLISQDETPTSGATSQKSSRHFSILSPFRSKTSEKKSTT
ncbi:hypothetical protein ACSBR2_030905 [Camellia fascicularis]